VQAPYIQYNCQGESFNWQKPSKANGPCAIGVNGNIFLGDNNDATGQIDVTKGEIQFRQFEVSSYEPCTFTVNNPQHRSGVRLSFCENAGAGLTRISYPQAVDKVEMANNYYDVQATDDVLLFTLASRDTQCVQATFMWSPSP